MSEIKCPHCGQMFTIDESEYANIASQVRTVEFDKELKKRLHEMEESVDSKIALKVAEAEQKATAASAAEIRSTERKLLDAEKEILELRSQLATADTKHESDMKLQKLTLETEAKEELARVNAEHARETRTLEEEVAHYKEFKAKSSTKMVGESLERYCMTEFDKLRATAFRGDYFEKDNTVSETGSKGDFIYRAYDDKGHELVSIMFEMKNEMESTAESQKHTNESFFKELDKDRREKDCEYAVLCSLLESENDLYNQGIVDVSHRYEKMYVIRPQFFIVIITLLRNAAMSKVELTHELALAKQSNIDIVQFESELMDFKAKFGKNCDLASRKFQETLDEIDKAITHLQKTRDALVSCDRNLLLADKKAEDLTVKRLLRKSPGLEEEYEKAKVTNGCSDVN